MTDVLIACATIWLVVAMPSTSEIVVELRRIRNELEKLNEKRR